MRASSSTVALAGMAGPDTSIMAHRLSATGPADPRCRKFLVTGKVQGVFFRDSTRQLARDLGLTGYAKNRRDGKVEVVACGSDDALARLGEWLETGPPMASVSAVESAEAETGANYDDFTIA